MLFRLLVVVSLTVGIGRTIGAQLAVTDFEAAGGGVAGSEAAFGLADVLAIELQQRGVTLWERQQIRVVLGERRLSASGLMQLHKGARSEIPDLEYLVTGQLRVEPNQFQLETALVATRTGQNVASFSAQGKQPEELTKALTKLAGEMADWLAAASPSVIRDVPPQARTNRKPEVSLLFYKGIEYCLADQPELAVTWFIDAERVAPELLATRVWTLRAFEMLGLTNLTTAARKRVQESPGGPALLNRLAASPLWDHRLVAVTVLADPRLGTSGGEFLAALKTALAGQTNLFVTDPANFRALAAEMDLQLTERGSRDLELDSTLWSAVDAVVAVTPGASDAGLVWIELRDARSGGIWLRRQVSSINPGMDELIRDLSAQINERRATGTPTVLLHNSNRPRAVKPTPYSNTDRNEFVALLRYLAEHPEDRSALQRLALFSRWLNARHDGSYQRAISDWIEAVTSADDPEAAHWLSVALWHRRYYDSAPAPMAQAAALLFERYPASPEAQYARSALAEELIGQKKYAEAATLFLQLATELPAMTNRVKIGPEYWANFYFFTAAALHESGDSVRARQFLERADEVLRGNPDLLFQRYALGVWVNHFLASHPLFGPERNLREAVAEWRQRLDSGVTNSDPHEITLRQLEELLAQAHASPGDEPKIKYLQGLSKHQRRHPELYQGRITAFDPREPWRQIRLWNATTAGNFTLIGKLIVEAPGVLKQLAVDSESPAGREEVHRMARQLAEPLDAPIAADFLEAVGEYELALHKVEHAQMHPTPFPESLSDREFRRKYEATQLRRQKIRLLQALGRALDAAAYAQSQIPDSTKRPPADVCMDAAEAYIAAGRPEEASRLFSQLVRGAGEPEQMDEYGATLRICWADYEAAAGDLFEASEILRAVAKASEGRNWGVYLRTGYAKAYDAAVSRLAKLRAQSEFTARSTDWASQPRRTTVITTGEQREQTDLERQLDAILRGVDQGGGGRRFGGAAVGEFARQFGRAAVPAILDAALGNESSARLIASLRILDRVATTEDTPGVLEAFKQSPYLAETAFRLDRTNAAAILRERFPIYAQGGNVPRELRQVLGQCAVVDQYPVLIANLAAKDLDGNTVVIARELDSMLQTNSTPQLLASYRAALTTVIERQMLSNYRHGLADLGEIALRWGWLEGMEALLHGGDPSAEDVLARLRKYVELPDDDGEARARLASALGRWQWNPATGKFVADDPAPSARATESAGDGGTKTESRSADPVVK